jgi:hypothetical protein
MMGFQKVLFCAILIFSFFKVFSQAHTDTITNLNSQEEVIFEYDTVVLPPDTIRITDTITMIDASEKKSASTKKFHLNLNNQAISFIGSGFITNQHLSDAQIIDSAEYTSSQPYNYDLGLFYSFDISNYTLSAGINFISFSEKSEKNYVLKKDTLINGFPSIRTDSINSKFRNYFYYTGFFVGVAYNINIEKLSISPELSFSFNKLLPNQNYKFEKGTTSLIIKNEKYSNLMLLSLSFPVAYEINKKIAVFLQPSFSGNLSADDLFPKTLKNCYRIGFGVKYFFR